jgi:hypothetical protein
MLEALKEEAPSEFPNSPFYYVVFTTLKAIAKLL